MVLVARKGLHDSIAFYFGASTGENGAIDALGWGLSRSQFYEWKKSWNFMTIECIM